MTITEYFNEYDTAPVAWPRFESGELVRDRYGRSYRVRSQTGPMVWVDGETDWWHPANLTRI